MSSYPTAPAPPGPVDPQPPVGRKAPRGPGWVRIVLGVVAMLAAIAAFVPWAILDTIEASDLNLSALDETRAPGSLEFKSEAKRYVVALRATDRSPYEYGSAEDLEWELVTETDRKAARCTVTHPDGRRETLSGEYGTYGGLRSNYEPVGTFDGEPGTTRIRCSFSPQRDAAGVALETPLIVHEYDEKSDFSRQLLWGSVGLGLGGLLLVVWGVVHGPRRRPPAPPTWVHAPPPVGPPPPPVAPPGTWGPPPAPRPPSA